MGRQKLSQCLPLMQQDARTVAVRPHSAAARSRSAPESHPLGGNTAHATATPQITCAADLKPLGGVGGPGNGRSKDNYLLSHPLVEIWAPPDKTACAPYTVQGGHTEHRPNTKQIQYPEQGQDQRQYTEQGQQAALRGKGLPGAGRQELGDEREVVAQLRQHAEQLEGCQIEIMELRNSLATASALLRVRTPCPSPRGAATVESTRLLI